jgi:hypothetical protein
MCPLSLGGRGGGRSILSLVVVALAVCALLVLATILREEETLQEISEQFVSNETTISIMTHHHVSSTAATIQNNYTWSPRPWKVWNDTAYPWCILPDDDDDDDDDDDTNNSQRGSNAGAGLYLVKIPKAGSSTAAGLTYQLATNVAARKKASSERKRSSTRICQIEARHGKRHTHRQQPYFLWAQIRHPASRAVSSYYFNQVSRAGKTPTYRAFVNWAQSNQGKQLDLMASRSWKNKNNNNHTTTRIKNLQEPPAPRFPVMGRSARKTTLEQVISMIEKDILNDEFQFVGILERLDESLVVMKMLFGFTQADMIILPSKLSGDYDGGASEQGCVKILKATPTAEMQRYLATEYCHPDNFNYDCVLYDMMNQTLDATIDALGRDRVIAQVKVHRHLQALAEEKCQDEAVFPCTKDGETQFSASAKSCYEKDWGCGHACVARVLKEDYDDTKEPSYR